MLGALDDDHPAGAQARGETLGGARVGDPIGAGGDNQGRRQRPRGKSGSSDSRISRKAACEPADGRIAEAEFGIGGDDDGGAGIAHGIRGEPIVVERRWRRSSSRRGARTRRRVQPRRAPRRAARGARPTSRRRARSSAKTAPDGRAGSARHGRSKARSRRPSNGRGRTRAGAGGLSTSLTKRESRARRARNRRYAPCADS